MKNIWITGLLLVGLFFSCKHQPKENRDAPISETYSDNWKFHAGGADSVWMMPGYSDSFWQIVTSSKLLKDQNSQTENGFGWYRKTIRLCDKLQEAIQHKGGIVLHLGRLAATDEVYFNGRLVGKTGDFPPDYKGYNDKKRNYFVPKDCINPTDDNLIAIKFHDGWSAGGFLGNLPLIITTAETNDKLTLTVEVADPDYIFLPPDSINITINLENKNDWAVEGDLSVTLTTDDRRLINLYSTQVKIEGKSTCSDALTELNHAFTPVPGFYRYKVLFSRNSQVACEKQFNIGYDPENIQSPMDAKADFQTFWENNLKELANVNPEYTLTLQPEYSQLDYNVYLVEMFSFGNELIRGYYAQPKQEGKYPVIVEYMGYGSSPYPPNQHWDGFAYFVLSIRGQALNQPENRFGKWITYGLDDKDHYYYRGAFLDVVRALDFVCSRPEIDAEKIAVRGGSQGGALSFVAASLDKRVKVAAPNIPFLSDYRDYFRIAPWPKSDFDEYMSQFYPDGHAIRWSRLYDLLTYFDIKNLAQWIECPVIMGFGVQDNVCPPHINFAAYNQIRSEKCWIAGPDFAHSTGKEYYDRSMQFIKEKLNVE
jgi:cephalosporin-C deacetylase-like acetyl esterase